MKPLEVMLVEDDTGEALLIDEILAESPTPVNLHVARDGMQALLMLALGQFHPDLVIVDLNLPYISGHGVIERYHPRDVPVVAFSSSANAVDKKRALESGAREYIQKPMDLSAYMGAVRGMVEKWAVRHDS